MAVAAKAYGKNPELITADAAMLEKLGLQAAQFPLLTPVGFSASDELWRKDFPFKRADLASTLLDMRDYNPASGFPKPGVGLDVVKEQEIITAQ